MASPSAIPGLRLRGKLLLVVLLPLLASLAITALVLRHQQQDLARRQQELVRNAYLETSQSELRHYVALALSTISPLYNTGRNDEEIQQAAMKQLAQLDYGPDGYFFLYHFDGTNLMHPRQPELVGRNLIEMRDRRGLAAIRAMIDKARIGGGFVEYTWNKPSSRDIAPKLAYVTGLARWQWMIGTGIYVDDLDRVMAQLDRQIEANVDTTMRWIGLAALVSIGVAVAGVLGIGLNELRAADAKLTLLTRQLVRSQEQERAWLSRELHDGTSQTLVAAKLLTESALARLPADDERARPVLQRAAGRINDAINDVRDISHRLRPSALDTLGLGTALRQLGEQTCAAAGLRFELLADDAPGLADGLPEEIRTTLFRVSQEALTNVLKHAGASSVRMALHITDSADHGAPGGLSLVIEDDGRGFDPDAVAQHPRQGIGLRNMRERLVAIGGQLLISSQPQRTLLRAEIPAEAIRRFAV